MKTKNRKEEKKKKVYTLKDAYEQGFFPEGYHLCGRSEAKEELEEWERRKKEKNK